MRMIPCKVHQAFRIGDVKFTVLKISGERVRFRVEAPHAVGIYREEVIRDLNDAARLALAPAELALASDEPDAPPPLKQPADRPPGSPGV